MGQPNLDVIPWVSVDDAQGCKECSGTIQTNTGVLVEAVQVASNLLYRLSGFKYPGERVIKLRPLSWAACGSGARLPLNGPVTQIVDVTIAGVTMSTDLYRLDDYNTLVRLDGSGWPSWQDMNADDDDSNAFTITVKSGVGPPVEGRWAAAIFSCHLAKLYTGQDCQLNGRVQSLSRQGVSMTLLDDAEFFDKGKTGLEMVDLFLANVNPSGKRTRQSRMINPDYINQQTFRTP